MKKRNKKPEFVPGLRLAEGFFKGEVELVLLKHYPDLKYSAALIGSGSEVLGFDTEMSTDHHWGPRVMLFLFADDYESKCESIREILSVELPTIYQGYSTNFSAPDPQDNDVQTLQPVDSGPVNHRVEMFTLKGFFAGYLGVDIEMPLDVADWLTLPHHKLCSITSGRVFRDDIGLNDVRQRFAWYPYDVWLYILASAWQRLGQEEHLMGRAGEAGDEKGSAVIGARLVRDVMRLAFLMEKEYPPYTKWFGTAFSRLKSAGKLEKCLAGALRACTWQEREEYLCTAYGVLAQIHNSLGITGPVASKVSQFWERPFKIIGGERIAAVIAEQIKDPQVVKLARKGLIGNIDLFSDNTDLLENASLRPVLRKIYK